MGGVLNAAKSVGEVAMPVSYIWDKTLSPATSAAAGATGISGGGGGGKKGGSAPAPPNYTGSAEQQGQSGQQSINQQTQANRPDINTGFGSQSWTQGANGNWTLNSSLSPALGGALGSLQGQAATNAATGPQSIADARNQAINSNYNYATSRLNPQWAQRDEQLNSQLVNQGLDPSSEAAKNALSQESRDRNDAYSSAMANAIGLGNQTQGVMQQGQMLPYQQMSALLGFQNGMPGFNAAGAYQPTQYLPAAEAQGAYGLQAWQGQNQANADQWAGVGQIAGAAAPFALASSDERIKSDVKRLPVEASPGIPLATFKYKHDPSGQHHLGVIAQDVEAVAPQHVQTGPDGIKRVNYAAVWPFGPK